MAAVGKQAIINTRIMRRSRPAVDMRQLNNTCKTEGDCDWEQLDLRAPPVQVLSCLKMEAQPASETSILIYRMDNVETKVRL